MRNTELAQIFREVALYLEMKEEPFKPRAYEKVAYSLEALEEPVGEIYRRGGVKALRGIPGVGQAIAEEIEEVIRTGGGRDDEEGKKKEGGVDARALTEIEGMGPKSERLLKEKLKNKPPGDLEKAARSGKI